MQLCVPLITTGCNVTKFRVGFTGPLLSSFSSLCTVDRLVPPPPRSLLDRGECHVIFLFFFFLYGPLMVLYDVLSEIVAGMKKYT